MDSSPPLGLFLSRLGHVSCHVVLQIMCALEYLTAHQALQNPLPPGNVPCKLVCRLGNAVHVDEVFREVLAVSKNQVEHCALVHGLLGRFLPPTLPHAAQFHVLLYVALVHDALAKELAGVPGLATVHGLLVSGELHPAVKHLTT